MAASAAAGLASIGMDSRAADLMAVKGGGGSTRRSAVSFLPPRPRPRRLLESGDYATAPAMTILRQNWQEVLGAAQPPGA